MDIRPTHAVLDVLQELFPFSGLTVIVSGRSVYLWLHRRFIDRKLEERLVLLEPRHHHSTPLLEKVHWLPISERIKYKVACMCFSAITGSGPAYLSELLYVYTVSYTTLFFWHLHTENPTIQTPDSWLLHFLLLWTPHWEFTSTRPKTLLNSVIF